MDFQFLAQISDFVFCLSSISTDSTRQTKGMDLGEELEEIIHKFWGGPEQSALKMTFWITVRLQEYLIESLSRSFSLSWSEYSSFGEN